MARTRQINLSRQTENHKKRLWQRIKTVNPPLAELLKDAEFQALKDHFDAEILVNASDLEAHHNG